ncbi:hypothetical protein HMPREF0299_6040 [Corynebacterium matruchotii ATCC 14266]|uniref:Uncharacterized protein n=1 Tax=Corynebacterium matruchotii ATCC 14266 TaxID=553207 RepID=E0DCJ0_9CORY|nr:hypothetical protein HMPREF0299_6040 [Corynebacterium matruchotii ATCC 14266]
MTKVWIGDKVIFHGDHSIPGYEKIILSYNCIDSVDIAT